MMSMIGRFKREKRFLLVTPEYVLGGAETQFRYLIDYAEKNKWKLDVIVGHRVKKDDELLREVIKHMKSVRFYEFDWRNADNKKLLFDTAIYILRNFPRIRYSACLIHNTQDLILTPMLRLFGIYVIYSERVDASVISQSLLFRKCLSYCNSISANSLYAQKELERLTGRKVRLIRNGKPVVNMLPIKENRRIDRILIPANIDPRKNQMLMLQYLRRYPNFRGKLVFAGHPVNRIYMDKLVRFVKINDLQGRIEFLGYVDNLKEEYRKADLIIVPSFAEGTPNVVLEAYAYGRPVIVSDIEAEKDVVRNPRLRFGINSVTELDGCIQYVQGLSDEAHRQLLKKNHRFVTLNYNIERMAEAFYKELSEGERRSLRKLETVRLAHYHKDITIRKENVK